MKIKTAAVFLALSLMFAVTCVAADEPAAPAAPEKKFGQEVGEFVKPFKVKFAESDKVLNSEELKTRSIFLLVSSVCTACRTEIEEMQLNLKEFAGKADIYAVIIDMDPASALTRMKEKAPNLVYLADPDYSIGSKVNMISAPSSVILDTDGKILYKKTSYSGGQWKEFARVVYKK